jgi:RimJ/RimL family protein N-acetyltransferase
LEDALMRTRMIETERLVMRDHRRDDFDECATMWADPVVTRHIGGKPLTPEESWTKFLRNTGHWSLMGFGYWVVREKVSGRFVGEVGFADLKRDVVPSLNGAPEGGWVLVPWAYGVGFATEALCAAIAWLEGRFGAVRTVCMIDDDNAASIRVATKCGYKEWSRASYRESQVTLFER